MRKKVCLLGEFAVGKTSLVRRFLHNKFDDKYLSTIGVKVSQKKVSVPLEETNDPVDVTIMLWDLAGGQNRNALRPGYLRGSAGAVLVCDMTRPETLTQLDTYVINLHQFNPDAQLVLAANKNDLTTEHQLTISDVQQAAAQFDAPYYFTSAKTGADVDTLFRQLGKQLVGS